MTVWITVLKSAFPSAAVLDLRFENGCIDRWARGDLDTSQGRGIEPFGPMLGSHLFAGLQGSPFDPCLDSAASFYELCCHAAIMTSVPYIHSQSSPSQGLHQIRCSMSLSSIGDRMKDGFKFGSAVRLHVGFRI